MIMAKFWLAFFLILVFSISSTKLIKIILIMTTIHPESCLNAKTDYGTYGQDSNTMVLKTQIPRGSYLL